MDRSINEKSNIVHAQADDLNGVFEAQGIVDQDKLIEETEDVECEEGWDCGLRLQVRVASGILFMIFKIDLKGSEDISVSEDQLLAQLVMVRALTTHASNARTMAPWPRAVRTNAHCHFDCGVYILDFGFRYLCAVGVAPSLR